MNDPPSLAFGTPGSNAIVCCPACGQRQLSSTEFGKRCPLDDLFCQIPVLLNVSRPSMNTRAWPASQQTSPIVPISAIARPVKRMLAGIDEIGSATKRSLSQIPGSVTIPFGCSAPAAIASARPPLDDQAEIAPAGAGPSKKRP